MGAWAARKALRILENAERVLAIEFLAACQGLELLSPLKTSAALRAALRAVRKVVPSLGEDRVLSEDIERMTALLQSGKVLAAAQRVAGPVP
jgi:histidine ammonia-lyase